MKKIILIIIILVSVAGCTNINKLSYDDIVNNITTISTKDNIYRTGYSYYLPRGMKVADSTLYNEVIEDANSKYYLYVDVVSYYKKVTKDYEINSNVIYSSKISYNDKFGYVEVNLLKNDKYLVEIMYNYAKIEVIVDKSKCKEAMLSIINTSKFSKQTALYLPMTNRNHAPISHQQITKKSIQVASHYSAHIGIARHSNCPNYSGSIIIKNMYLYLV